jgi:phage anti-repressor protein
MSRKPEVQNTSYNYFYSTTKTPQLFGQGGGPQIDYLVTPDIAKELGMLERNARGRAIRSWFIRKGFNSIRRH